MSLILFFLLNSILATISTGMSILSILIPDQIYFDSLGKTAKDRDAKTLTRFFVDLARKDMDLASDIIATFIKEKRKEFRNSVFVLIT